MYSHFSQPTVPTPIQRVELLDEAWCGQRVTADRCADCLPLHPAPMRPAYAEPRERSVYVRVVGRPWDLVDPHLKGGL